MAAVECRIAWEYGGARMRPPATHRGAPVSPSPLYLCTISSVPLYLCTIPSVPPLSVCSSYHAMSSRPCLRECWALPYSLSEQGKDQHSSLHSSLLSLALKACHRICMDCQNTIELRLVNSLSHVLVLIESGVCYEP